VAVAAGFTVADAGGAGCGWLRVFGVAEGGEESQLAADVVTTFSGLDIA